MESNESPRLSRYAQAMRAMGEDYAGRPRPDPAIEDNTLIQRALDGEMEAFAGLMARYERKAFWVAFQVVGSIEEARDLVQEAFLRVHRSLDRFDFSRNFYTWLYRIVTNLAIDSLRKSRNEPRQVSGEGIDLPDEEERYRRTASPEEQERAARVRAVLDTLPPRFRTVLALRDLHGLSCREIGPILDLTYATVRWRLHKARQLFRLHWERSLPKGEDHR